MGIQMAGSDMSQKRKKHMKSRVFVPDEAGIELADGLVSPMLDGFARRTYEGSPRWATSP